MTANTPIGYTIEDAKRLIPCGHTKIYELIGQGQLVAVKLGRRTIITAESLNSLMATLPPANIGQARAKSQKTA